MYRLLLERRWGGARRCLLRRCILRRLRAREVFKVVRRLRIARALKAAQALPINRCALLLLRSGHLLRCLRSDRRRTAILRVLGSGRGLHGGCILRLRRSLLALRIMVALLAPNTGVRSLPVRVSLLMRIAGRRLTGDSVLLLRRLLGLLALSGTSATAGIRLARLVALSRPTIVCGTLGARHSLIPSKRLFSLCNRIGV